MINKNQKRQNFKNNGISYINIHVGEGPKA